MPRYTRTEIQSLVVGQIIANLRHESIVDIDDGEFIAKALDFQNELAVQLEHLYPHVSVAVRPSRHPFYPGDKLMGACRHCEMPKHHHNHSR